MLRALLLRWARPRSRALELARLRARFAAMPRRRLAGADAVAVAEELLRLRTELIAALGAVRSCAGCAHGHPLPHGRWGGGHCCGGSTLELFSQLEVWSLVLVGVRARELVAPDGDHAGCAFRGPTGCALSPRERPNVCVLYVCHELRQELEQSGRWPELKEPRRRAEQALRDLAKLAAPWGIEEPASIAAHAKTTEP